MPGALADTLRRERERRARAFLARAALSEGNAAAAAARLVGASRARGRLRGVPLEGVDSAPLAVRVLSRLAFGPRPGDIDAFQALAGSDEARLAAWVDEQLDPHSIADADVETRIAAMPATTLAKTREQLWADHVAANPEWHVRLRPAIETERASFLRAIYSQRQLFEVLVDFWHDHFNVYGWDYISAPMWVHYDRDVIRANALGNFRTLLGAVAASPAMLVYLDAYTSTVAGPNENYARELLELHTLGAENYFGVVHQHEVPLDAQGTPLGYCDDDVYEVTRCFTGWTLAEATGATRFKSDWHDRFQKRVLGLAIPPHQPPFKDGNDVLDLLAAHPGTARYIARKLTRRLIGDPPPQRVVDEAAAAFAANAASPSQLREVVRVIALSPEFTATWGAKVRRPFELVVAALRAAGAEMSLALDDDLADSFFWLFEATGNARFSWRPPDGYSDFAGDWLSTATLVPAWRLVNWVLSAHSHDGGEVPVVDVLALTPAGVTSARGLADFWIARMLGRPLPEGSRSEIIEFMAQGRNPDVPLRLSEDEVRDRVVAMVGLIAMAPHFLWR